MNFTESWSRKAFFKSLNPILSKFGQKGSLIESHSKEKKTKKEIEKNPHPINSIITTTHFKVSYLGCMFSFSFCSTGIFTLSKPESTVVVLGCFFSSSSSLPLKKKRLVRATLVKVCHTDCEPVCESILQRQKERDEGHWRKESCHFKTNQGEKEKSQSCRMLLQTVTVQSSMARGTSNAHGHKNSTGTRQGRSWFSQGGAIHGTHLRQLSTAGSCHHGMRIQSVPMVFYLASLPSG